MRTMLALLLLVAGWVPALADPASEEFTKEMLAQEAAWLAAYDNHDVEAMKRIVADDFSIVYPDGNVMNKADTVGMLTPGTPTNTEWKQYTENSTVRVWGDTAVISGVFVFEGPQRTERSRYTDTWIRQDGHWQVVASHLTRLE